MEATAVPGCWRSRALGFKALFTSKGNWVSLLPVVLKGINGLDLLGVPSGSANLATPDTTPE